MRRAAVTADRQVVEPPAWTAARSWNVAAAVLTLASSLLCFQGWRQQWDRADDRVINVDEAQRWLTEGRAPRHGGYATTGGFNPPGLSYLYAPGIATGDMRLHERVGTGILHVATCVGLWLTMRLLSSRFAAAVVVAVYAFTPLGVHFASSLWPRANPGCYVWMTYFLLRWVAERRAGMLCGAVACYAVGCYIFLEFLPAGLAFPVLWRRYRPPVRWAPTLAAAGVALAVWYPYLEFEVRRGFRDVTMQLVAADPAARATDLSAWAERLEAFDPATGELGPYRPIETAEDLDATQATLKRLFFRGLHFTRNFAALFTYNWGFLGLPAFAVFLWPIAAWSGRACARVPRLTNPSVMRFIGGGLLVVGLVANPWVAAALMRRPLEPQEFEKVLQLEAFLLGAATLAIGFRQLAPWLRRACDACGIDADDEPRRTAHDALYWSFVPVWFAMAALADRPRYFMWMWSVQALILTLAVAHYPLRRLRLRAVAVGACAALALWCVVTAPTVERVRDWSRDGYAGRDLSYVRALDALADDYRRSRPDDVAPRVGYHVWFVGYELDYARYDSRYKPGAPLDQYLRLQRGLRNATDTPLGVAADDDYRVVFPNSFKTRYYRVKPDDLERYELIRRDDDGPGDVVELWKRKHAAH